MLCLRAGPCIDLDLDLCCFPRSYRLMPDTQCYHQISTYPDVPSSRDFRPQPASLYTAPPSGLLATAEEATIMVASHVIHKAHDSIDTC